MNNQHTYTVPGKYYVFLIVMFVAVLMVSNTVSVKITEVGPFIFDAGTWVFPIAYIFGDVFTEVYGYAATRRAIWYAVCAQLFMAFAYLVVQLVPAAPFWHDQSSYDAILGVAPRIVSASLIAMFAGEFLNAFVMSKMKVVTEGRHLWVRTIGSTVVGEFVDTGLFVLIAFFGMYAMSDLITIIISNYVFKVSYEVIATPLTYAVIGFLKRAEKKDVYDTDISYNPFIVT